MPNLMMGLALLASIFTLALGAFVALYVLGSLGLYTLARNAELESPWMAWVPFARRYLLGELTGNKMWGFEGSKWVLSIVPLVLVILPLSYVGIGLSMIIGIVYTVYYYMVLFQLYKKYRPQSADLFIITSIIFEFLIPIYTFVIRNNKPVEQIQNQEELKSQELYQDSYKDQEELIENQPEGIELEQPLYEDVRRALAEINAQEQEEITVAALNDEEAADIENRIEEINAELENFVNSENTQEDYEIELVLPTQVEITEEELKDFGLDQESEED